jgi:hypothetical protein
MADQVSQGGITVPAELDSPTAQVSQGGITVASEFGTTTYDQVSQGGITVPAETVFQPVQVSQGGITVVGCVPPAAPTGLTATLSGATSVSLSWTDNADTEIGYTVEARVDGGAWTEVASLAAGSTSYEHTGLTPDSVYEYRVTAEDALCGASSGTTSINVPRPARSPTPYRRGAARTDLLVVHRGWDGAKLNEFIGRGRRASNPGGMRYCGYDKRLRTPGSWILGFNAHDERVLDFRPYHIVEFWLRDGFGGDEYDAFLASLPAYRKDPFRPQWYRDFTGFVLTYPELDQTADGAYVSTLRGRGLNEWLYSEYIDYAPGTSEAEKSSASETVAKEYVDENIGPNAGTDAGGYSRVREGLSVQADAGNGATWEGDRSRKLLGDVLQEIADMPTGPGDYMIVQVGDALFDFQWRSPHWGEDKRVGNGVRRPVLFSARMDNVEDVSSSISYLSAASGVIVYGQGVGSTLKPGTAYDTTLTTQTSWARKVLVRQSRSTVDQTALNDFAYGELRENWPEIDVDSTVKQIFSSRYNVHWQLGDLVTVEDTLYGRQIDRKVLGVRVTLEAASDSGGGLVTIRPALGDFINVT